MYGIFFAFTYRYNYKLLTSKNLILKLLISFFFVLNHILLYFILIRIINNGKLHIYFFFVFILGTLFFSRLFDTNKINKID